MEEDDMDMDVDTCLRGFWKDGICLCDSGYATLFSESYHLRPLYCDHHLSDLDTETTWEMDGMEFLSYAVMALAVGIGVFGVLSLLVFSVHLWSLLSLSKGISSVRRDTYDFISSLVTRKEANLHCDLWEPQLHVFSCFTDVTNKKKNTRKKTKNARVVHTYNAQDKDELTLLQNGEIICEVTKLDNGWCKGTLRTQTGFFPTAYVEFL